MVGEKLQRHLKDREGSELILINNSVLTVMKTSNFVIQECFLSQDITTTGIAPTTPFL